MKQQLVLDKKKTKKSTRTIPNDLFKVCVNKEIVFTHANRIKDKKTNEWIPNPDGAAMNIFHRFKKKFGIANVTDVAIQNTASSDFQRIPFKLF